MSLTSTLAGPIVALGLVLPAALAVTEPSPPDPEALKQTRLLGDIDSKLTIIVDNIKLNKE